MTKFKTISSIEIDNEVSWQDSIFLTFDIDWAHDEIINDTISLVEQAGVAATWFITHDTPVLKRLHANSMFELGMHPNFNFLLGGHNDFGDNADEIIEKLKTIVPESRLVRSHSMTQNSRLLDLFIKNELTHDVNHFIPAQAGIELRPWMHWNNIIKVPYNWEDDVYCVYGFDDGIADLAVRPGINVFDFHPVHVFLNTENLNRYERTRAIHQKPKELIKGLSYNVFN